MTPLQLIAQVRARADAATPGPWALEDNTIYANPRPAERGGTNFDAQICEMLEDMDTDEVSEDDAEFIASARTDVPALCNLLARAVELLEHHRGHFLCHGYETEAATIRDFLRGEKP